MIRKLIVRSFNEYGMLVVLLLLCAYFSLVTYQLQPGAGATGGRDGASQVLALPAKPKSVLIVAAPDKSQPAFVEAAATALSRAGVSSVSAVVGDPPIFRKAAIKLIEDGVRPDAIIADSAAAQWVPRVLSSLPEMSGTPVATPHRYMWPTFLNADNLTNIASQIAVIAIIAVGMTMVIITGGIDLSVGSLVAMSAVITARLIRDHGGVEHAGTTTLICCSAVAIVVAGLVGAFSGSMVTLFGVPPFIATLAMMQVVSGRAYNLSAGQSIYDVPKTFQWLGLGFGLGGIPNTVWLMVVLFAAAHVMMSRTSLGRYIYAVGGNREAARLSGVPVKRVLLSVYIASGLTAGIGGVILASQFKGGSPTYGEGYELFVIAAVVVGGTSLAGGEGQILSTLIGVFIIAVIRNGMNLTGIDSYGQKEVLGWVLLGAVLLDQLKKRPWKWPGWFQWGTR